MAVRQIIKPVAPSSGAILRKPNGDIYLELPETPYVPHKEGETRKINDNTGYWVKKVNESNGSE